ncbi:neutral amino acid transporter [Gaertneriomyces sp. JEL0708]|nr:neutral amino acid transporter [Gaertneriomyces sp. JEL0708]
MTSQVEDTLNPAASTTESVVTGNDDSVTTGDGSFKLIAPDEVQPSSPFTQRRSLLGESLKNRNQIDRAKRNTNYGSFQSTQYVTPALPPPGSYSPDRLGHSPALSRSIPKSLGARLENPGGSLGVSNSSATGAPFRVRNRLSVGNLGSFQQQQPFGTPGSFASSPLRSGRNSMASGRNSPAPHGGSDTGADLRHENVAKLVAEHLVQPVEGETTGRSPHSFVGSVSHGLLGGEVTRDIYHWQEKQEAISSHRRRNSEPDIRSVAGDVDNMDEAPLRASDLREPGVFRRHFLLHQAAREGKALPNALTRSFLDFLALYGSYGGDVFPEDDDEYDEGDEEDGEFQPLIRPRPPSRTPSVQSVHGTSAKKAFFMVLKAFVGTGVLFLPKAFANGGMLFSTVTLVIIGYLTLHCMLLLVELNRTLGGSFGDIGDYLYGSKMRQLVLGSIALSQAGFCCAYYIFVAQNLRDFVMVASDCKWILPDWVFLLIQLVVYAPLSWVRRIKHFSITSLIADVFILLGLAYILYYDIFTVSTRGPATDMVWFNSQSFPLFVGTAMFAFEGICLILPIGESMKRPDRFPAVLGFSTIIIGIIFISVGGMGYLTFGSKVETIVFLNLPTGVHTQALQFFYAIAIMLSFPLTVYPSIRITEHGIFGLADGKHSQLVKWQKNMYRLCLVSCLAGVAWLGRRQLERVVSLVGCFACIPLSFIYPSLFHSHIATKRWVRLKDMALVVFGICAMVYTTWITLEQWATGEPDVPIDRCHASP